MIDNPADARQRPELRDLVLPERLGREEEQGSRGGVLGDRLERRQRVTERLARRGGRDDHDVLAGVDRLDRFGLMDVERIDAARCQPRHDPRIQPRRHGGVDGLAGRDDRVMDHPTRHRRLREQVGEDRRGVGWSIGTHHRIPHWQPNGCSEWMAV